MLFALFSHIIAINVLLNFYKIWLLCEVNICILIDVVLPKIKQTSQGNQQ